MSDIDQYVDPTVNTGSYEEDDGTMPSNIATLADAVVGQKIVKVEKGSLSVPERGYRWGASEGLIITLDNGKRVEMADTDDCCAYTALNNFLLHPDRVDHIITGVRTEGGYTHWHIYADMGDVLELEVGWSAGNPFYYGYGFDIEVKDV